MDPERALPSYWVYRGSLLALIAGSVVAVWLLVFSPQGSDPGGRPPASIAGVLGRDAPSSTSTPTPASQAGALPRATAEAGPAVSAVPTATPTATPTAATPTPEAELEYTVQEGDTLSAIIDLYLAPGGDREEFLERIVERNGITDVSNIQIGQVITIPAQ